jgi:hypothetical protein
VSSKISIPGISIKIISLNNTIQANPRNIYKNQEKIVHIFHLKEN